MDKGRFTVLTGVNGDGSSKSAVVIGKSKTPNGTSPQFWSENRIKYFSNATGWMNCKIFRSLVKDFDSTLPSRTIILVDNFQMSKSKNQFHKGIRVYGNKFDSVRS
jgi:DDE superfamily endonuclease